MHLPFTHLFVSQSGAGLGVPTASLDNNAAVVHLCAPPFLRACTFVAVLPFI